jgi:hypothetical protein
MVRPMMSGTEAPASAKTVNLDGKTREKRLARELGNNVNSLPGYIVTNAAQACLKNQIPKTPRQRRETCLASIGGGWFVGGRGGRKGESKVVVGENQMKSKASATKHLRNK